MHQSRFSPSQSRYDLAYRAGVIFTLPLLPLTPDPSPARGEGREVAGKASGTRRGERSGGRLNGVHRHLRQTRFAVGIAHFHEPLIGQVRLDWRLRAIGVR